MIMFWAVKRLFAITTLLTSACAPSTPAGTFSFSATALKNDFTTLPGIHALVSFKFQPSLVGASCLCTEVGMVQIISMLNLSTHAFDLAPDADQFARIVRTGSGAGWALDRTAFHKWGYYGQNDDGSYPPFIPGGMNPLVPGSNDTVTTLEDRPTVPPDRSGVGALSPPHGSYFRASDAPVCIQGDSSCINRILGFYEWSFVVNPDGSVPLSSIVDGGGSDFSPQLYDAIDAWNKNLNGSVVKFPFPALTPLASAIAGP